MYTILYRISQALLAVCERFCCHCHTLIQAHEEKCSFHMECSGTIRLLKTQNRHVLRSLADISLLSPSIHVANRCQARCSGRNLKLKNQKRQTSCSLCIQAPLKGRKELWTQWQGGPCISICCQILAAISTWFKVCNQNRSHTSLCTYIIATFHGTIGAMTLIFQSYYTITCRPGRLHTNVNART